LKPNVDKYNIIYDFSKVDYKYKEDITFEDIISGTFILCGRVLDASKMIGFAYKYNDNESTLTIELDTSKWDFRLKKEVLFSYQLNVDDSSSQPTEKNIGNSTFSFRNGSSDNSNTNFTTTIGCSPIDSNDTNDTNVCQCPDLNDITVNYKFPAPGPSGAFGACNKPIDIPFPFQNKDDQSYKIQNIPSACERSNVKLQLQAFNDGTSLTGNSSCQSYWTS
jgi:hypothetical protein